MSSFEDVCKNFNKEHKAEIISKGLKSIKVEKIPFSSPYLNYITHGGFPRGKVVEFFGAEGSGKTTSALDVVASAQEVFKSEWEKKCEELQGAKSAKEKAEYQRLLDVGPLKVVYFDLEHTLDADWAYTLGVDLDELYLADFECQSAEEILDFLVKLTASDEVGLIVLDSIPYLEPEAQLSQSLEKKEYGGISKILSAFFRKVTPLLNTTTASLLLINQMRDSMDPFKMYETPGGRALKHACSLRLMFRKGELYGKDGNAIPKSSELAYSHKVDVKVEKTKICKPDRLKGSYILDYYEGIDWVRDLFDICLNEGVIVQSGAWFNFTHPESGEIIEEFKSQGKAKALQLLKSNDELLNEYANYVHNNIIL